MRSLISEIRIAASDNDVWALAITGNGDAFCSGLDLASIGSDGGQPESEKGGGPGDEPERDDGVSNHFAYLLRVECEKPVLAGVNGVAVGIGVSLAMACDIRIAAPSARFHPGYAGDGDTQEAHLHRPLTSSCSHQESTERIS